MTARRRWRWICAKGQRELRESYFFHLGIVRSVTWPFREPETWWYYRRVRAGLKRGVWVIQA